MRRSAVASIASALAFLSACEQAPESEAPESTEPVVERFSTPVVDELPGLAAEPAGIAFWEHPTLVFNGLMLLAGPDGLKAYNIEDGNETSAAPGFDAGAVAVAYAGFGPQAAGLVAVHDRDAMAVRFFGVENTTRQFLPLGEPAPVRGAVRGACFGRAPGAASPTLYVIQADQVRQFEVTPTIDGVAVAEGALLNAPADLNSCAVARSGRALFLGDDGALWRLSDANPPAAPVARTTASDPGGVVALKSDPILDEVGNVAEGPAPKDLIAVLDKADGALHVIDEESGAVLGIVAIGESFDVPATTAASAIGATAANLGAVYRNGAVALAIPGDEPSVRLIPVNALQNAIGAAEGAPVSDRGAAPEEEDDGLIIKTGFQPE